MYTFPCSLLEVTEKCERLKRLTRKRTFSEADRYCSILITCIYVCLYSVGEYLLESLIIGTCLAKRKVL